MTILTQQNSISYAGDGVTQNFPVPFYFIDAGHLHVSMTTGTLTLDMIFGVHYDVIGAGDMNGGAVITLVIIPPGTTLKIERLVPIIQTDDYVAHNTFPAETMEKDLDYLTMICQQLSDDIANLPGGSGNQFAMTGSAGVSVYAGTSGNTALFKRIVGAGGTVATEDASQITITSSAAAIDLAADYPWTGHHTWSKLAVRTVPSQVMKSLGQGDIVDGNILLANDYVALLDMRKTTNVQVAGESPVDLSWGGNFLLYGQHKITGTANNLGWAGGGIRMQAETSAVRTFGSPGVIAGYFGVGNYGTDQGAFGVHVDAYHSGTYAGFSHSTYAFSGEVWKNVAGGLAAGAILRSMSTAAVDFGLHILHANPPPPTPPGGAAGFKRGIQFGSPLITNGGLPGGTGILTPFDVGIDMSWGAYANNQAIYIKAMDYVILSGQPNAQSAALQTVCALRFNSATGNFQVNAFGTEFFGVNMSTGIIWQNGGEAIAMFDNTRPWVFRCTSAGGLKTATFAGAAGPATALPATPASYLKILVDGSTYKIPLYN